MTKLNKRVTGRASFKLIGTLFMSFRFSEATQFHPKPDQASKAPL